MTAEIFAEIWRGDFLECVHRGHAVICDETGQIVQAWGDPDEVILPRSSCKIIQALPLMESGAAAAAGLTDDRLALACASHNAAEIHTSRVQAWLAELGLNDDALRCGPQFPRDPAAEKAMIKTDGSPCQYHNNCSGKHSGFLTLAKHLRAGPEYVEIDHPVQVAVKAAFEETTGMTSPGYGIDGCSAPNFATTVHGLARAMASFAAPDRQGPARAAAMTRLVAATTAYPELVAGEGRACTALMRAMDGRVSVKTGAEGVFVAIIPEKRMGVALKITDGARRASECAIAAILVKLGVLSADHPTAQSLMDAPVSNWRGIVTGQIRAGAALR